MNNPSVCGVKTRLSVCALGLGFGVTFALTMLVFGILAWHYHFATPWVHVVSSVYVGFAATPKGIIIGALWALLEGFILGVLIAAIYNFSLMHCPCPGCKKNREDLNKMVV